MLYTGLAWGGRYVLCYTLALHGEGGMLYTGLAWGGRYVLCYTGLYCEAAYLWSIYTKLGIVSQWNSQQSQRVLKAG